MTSQRPRFVLISLTSAALCGVLAAAPAAAETSHCKGLAQTQCGTTEGCGWIDAFKRKDGKTVDGYCKKATTPPGAGRNKAAAGGPAPTATPAAPAPGTAKPAAGTGQTPAPMR